MDQEALAGMARHVVRTSVDFRDLQIPSTLPLQAQSGWAQTPAYVGEHCWHLTSPSLPAVWSPQKRPVGRPTSGVLFWAPGAAAVSPVTLRSPLTLPGVNSCEVGRAVTRTHPRAGQQMQDTSISPRPNHADHSAWLTTQFFGGTPSNEQHARHAVPRQANGAIRACVHLCNRGRRQAGLQVQAGSEKPRVRKTARRAIKSGRAAPPRAAAEGSPTLLSPLHAYIKRAGKVARSATQEPGPWAARRRA